MGGKEFLPFSVLDFFNNNFPSEVVVVGTVTGNR